MRVQANDKVELINKIYNEKGIIKVADVLDKGRSTNGMAVCKAVQSKTETECDVILEGPTEIVMAETAVAAADYMHDKYGVSQVNCTKY